MNRQWLVLAGIGMLFAGTPRPGMADNTPLVPADSVPADTILQGDGEQSAYPPRYTFRAQDVDIETALNLFCAAVPMRLRLDTVLQGRVSVEFREKTLPEAMSILLRGCSGCRWTREGDLLRVSGSAPVLDSLPRQAVLEILPGISGGERLFRIDYPRLRRSGSGSSAATLSGASGDGGNVNLNTEDQIAFWEEIEAQVQAVAPAAKIVANRLAGILYVSAEQADLDRIEQYLRLVVGAVTRQVEITARIYEVTLTDDQSLGIDWERVSRSFSVDGMQFTAGLSTHLIQSGGDYKAATISLDLSRDNGALRALLAALKQQGDVRAVSQPRVVTLNNQPALIKVGTDYPYFTASVTIDPSSGTRDVQEQVQVITVGIILSVTPQIAEDGWVTLGVQPVVTDLVRTEVSPNGSTAPVIDVKQSSTLVRLRNRETVRISGLLHTKESEIQRKIPLLGDIPILGALFRWRYTAQQRKELVIFLTPRIL